MKLGASVPRMGQNIGRKNKPGICSAPSGADEFNAHSSFNRAFAPTGAVNISVKNIVSFVCSAPIGAGDYTLHLNFYRHSAPHGAGKHINLLIL